MSEPGSIEDAADILRANYRGHAKKIRIVQNDDAEFIEVYLPALSQIEPPPIYMGHKIVSLNADTREPFKMIEVVRNDPPPDPARYQAEQRARAVAPQPVDQTARAMAATLQRKEEPPKGKKEPTLADTQQPPPPIAPSRQDWADAGMNADDYDAEVKRMVEREGYAPPREEAKTPLPPSKKKK